MQVRQPETVELTGDEGELLPVVRRSHVVERRVGGEMDADPLGGPGGRDRFDHLVQKAVAGLDAPAVLVGAVVRLRLEKLVDQVAIGGVELHAVETCLFRSFGGSPVVVHDPWNLGRFQRPWNFIRLLAIRGVDLPSVDLDRRRRDGGPAAVEAAVGGPSRVPELEEDQPALGVHGVGRELPAFDHLVGVDARRLAPAVGLLGDGDALRDDQARRTALGVVFGHQAVRQAIGPGSASRHGGHHDPVPQSQVAKVEGLEESTVHGLLLSMGRSVSETAKLANAPGTRRNAPTQVRRRKTDCSTNGSPLDMCRQMAPPQKPLVSRTPRDAVRGTRRRTALRSSPAPIT